MRFEGSVKARHVVAFAATCAVMSSAGCVAPGEPAPAEPAEVFALTCAHCHASGLEAAPQAGVPAHWNARDTRDVDVLVARVIAGHGNMPPLGSCSWCTRDQIRGVLAMMLVGADGADAASPSSESAK